MLEKIASEKCMVRCRPFRMRTWMCAFFPYFAVLGGVSCNILCISILLSDHCGNNNNLMWWPISGVLLYSRTFFTSKTGKQNFQTQKYPYTQHIHGKKKMKSRSENKKHMKGWRFYSDEMQSADKLQSYEWTTPTTIKWSCNLL